MARRNVNRRAQRVSVYFWPNVEVDKVVIDVINTLKTAGRSSDILRLAMLRGMRELVESGDMPPALIDRLDLKRRLSVRIPSPDRPMPVFQMPVIYTPVPVSPPESNEPGHPLDAPAPVTAPAARRSAKAQAKSAEAAPPAEPASMPSFTEAAIMDIEAAGDGGGVPDMLSGLMGLMSSNRASREAPEA